jgi:hypothetical protein
MEVLVLAGVLVALAVLGLLLWPMDDALVEPWRVAILEVIAAAVLIAIAGRFLVPRHSAVVLTEEGILRRDHFSLSGIAAWSEDTWLAEWSDVLNYQIRRESTETPGISQGPPGSLPPRVRLTFNVLGRYGSRPVQVLCEGSAQELATLEEMVKGQVARDDAGLLEAYRLKRPVRARRWDMLFVAACATVGLFPDLVIQAGLTACGSSAAMEAAPLDALPLWRYVLGGVIIVLAVALTTRVQHAISPALALAAFFFSIPAALVPLDPRTMGAFLAGQLPSGATTLGIAFILLLKLGVVAAITAAWREYVIRGVHDGLGRGQPARKRRPPPPPG